MICVGMEVESVDFKLDHSLHFLTANHSKEQNMGIISKEHKSNGEYFSCIKSHMKNRR